MLLIDRVTDCAPGAHATGFKLFSYNEWFFHGYDTVEPKVWNVIQIEAMSQMFLMTFLTLKEFQGAIAVSSRFNNVNFRRKISCGERLDLFATLSSFNRGVASGSVNGSVGGMAACSMDCVIVLPDTIGQYQKRLPKVTDFVTPRVAEISADSNFGISEIKKCLRNRFPWLFLDAVIEIQPGSRVVAKKNFTYNESFFPSHFPEWPSVPGFIQLEACMQAFLLTFLSLEQYRLRETVDRRLDNVLLKRKIVPGETLEIHAVLSRLTRGVAHGHVDSYVDGEPAVSFDVVSVIPDEFERFRPKF